jgi:hypothetical protein
MINQSKHPLSQQEEEDPGAADLMLETENFLTDALT